MRRSGKVEEKRGRRGEEWRRGTEVERKRGRGKKEGRRGIEEEERSRVRDEERRE